MMRPAVWALLAATSLPRHLLQTALGERHSAGNRESPITPLEGAPHQRANHDKEHTALQGLFL